MFREEERNSRQEEKRWGILVGILDDRLELGHLRWRTMRRRASLQFERRPMMCVVDVGVPIARKGPRLYVGRHAHVTGKRGIGESRTEGVGIIRHERAEPTE